MSTVRRSGAGYCEVRCWVLRGQVLGTARSGAGYLKSGAGYCEVRCWVLRGQVLGTARSGAGYC